MEAEYYSQHGIDEMLQALGGSEPIVYRENGNRRMPPRALLRQIRELLPRVGVTRLADVSYVSPLGLPVFQATRPSVFCHTRMGQNTGSQGKGRTKIQATVSCLMEAIEGFCMEPREPMLVRNSFRFLSRCQFVIDPRRFSPSLNGNVPDPDEPLMWTKALSVRHGHEVLIPAECAYFPFNPSRYGTRSIFQQGSNGLASGSSYLEATTHALYELIERHYGYFHLSDDSAVERLTPDSLPGGLARAIRKIGKTEFEVELFLIRIRNVRENLPVVFARLKDGKRLAIGYGCSSSVQVSAERALSESVQSHAAGLSGSREDLAESHGLAGFRLMEMMGRMKTPGEARRSRGAARILNLRFKNLGQEYRFIRRWLGQNGFKDIYLVNLTRNGIGVPVVKAIVPGLEISPMAMNSYRWRPEAPESFQFRFSGAKP